MIKFAPCSQKSPLLFFCLQIPPSFFLVCIFFSFLFVEGMFATSRILGLLDSIRGNTFSRPVVSVERNETSIGVYKPQCGVFFLEYVLEGSVLSIDLSRQILGTQEEAVWLYLMQ